MKNNEMPIEKIYRFKKTNFDNDGFHKQKHRFLFSFIRRWISFNDGFHQEKYRFLFSDYIRECETKFHEKNAPFFANTLWANASTFLLLKKCLNFDDNYILGLESFIINDVDFDLNDTILDNINCNTIYAIGKNNNHEEQLFLIIDSNISDSKFILKFLPKLSDDNYLKVELPSPKIKGLKPNRIRTF